MDWSELEEHLLVDEGYATSTAANRAKSLRRMERWGYPITEDPVTVGREWIAYRLREDKLKPASINQEILAINDLIAFHDIDHRYPLRDRDGGEIRTYTDDQVQQLYHYEHEDDYLNRLRRALLSVSLKTGAGRGEILDLRRGDIDLDERTIRIDHPRKGHNARTLRFSDYWLFSPKRPFVAHLRNKPQLAEDPAEDPVWVVQGPRNEPPRKAQGQTLYKHLWEVGQELGYTVNFNVSRHTCAKRWRRRGADLFFLKKWLGHNSIESTQVYAAYGSQEHERTAAAFNPEPDPYQVRK